MDGESAVLEVEQPLEAQGGENAQLEAGAGQQAQTDDPFSSKASKEYTAWLKSLRDSGDEQASRWARLAKNNHGEQFALRKEFPGGVNDAVQMKALVDSVTFTDPERGELKGTEAISAIQDQVRELAEVDELFAKGDLRALDAFDESFNEGFAKLAPAILDRIAKANPEAYAEAIFPHLARALGSSELVSDFYAMAEVLNEKMPSWLPDDKKGAWQEDRMQRLIGYAVKMDGFFAAQYKKLAELGNGAKPGSPAKPGSQPDDERTRLQNEQRDHHWKTSIIPERNRMLSSGFNEAFRPYMKRLNLDAPALKALRSEFGSRVIAKATANKNYKDAITRFYSQPKADPSSVVNLARSEFNNHYKNVMTDLVNERYKPFLNGQPKTQQTQGNVAKPLAPAQMGIRIVTVRPPEDKIDHRARTTEDIYNKVFVLKDGSRVRLQR